MATVTHLAYFHDGKQIASNNQMVHISMFTQADYNNYKLKYTNIVCLDNNVIYLYNHPFCSAKRAASVRLRAPNFCIAVER